MHKATNNNYLLNRHRTVSPLIPQLHKLSKNKWRLTMRTIWSWVRYYSSYSMTKCALLSKFIKNCNINLMNCPVCLLKFMVLLRWAIIWGGHFFKAGSLWNFHKVISLFCNKTINEFTKLIEKYTKRETSSYIVVETWWKFQHSHRLSDN